MQRTASIVLAMAIGLFGVGIGAQEDEESEEEYIRRMEGAVERLTAEAQEREFEENVSRLRSGDPSERFNAINRLLTGTAPPERKIAVYLAYLDGEAADDTVRQGCLRGIAGALKQVERAPASVLRRIDALNELVIDRGEPTMVRVAATEILAEIARWRPREAVGALIRALRMRVRGLARNVVLAIVRAIGDVGPTAGDDGRRELERILVTESDPIITSVTFQALGQVAVRDAGTIFDEDAAARAGAFVVLEAEGRRAADSVLDLVRVYRDDTSPLHVRAASIRTLGAVAPSDEIAIAAIVEALASSEEVLHGAAVSALSNLTPDDADAAGALSEGLSHPVRRVRGSVAEALGRLGGAARPAAGGVLSALAEADATYPREIVDSYLSLLRKIGSLPPAGPILLDLARSDSRLLDGRDSLSFGQLRTHLLCTLARVGVPRDGLPFLREVLSEGHIDRPYEWAGAARAVWSMGPEGASAVPELRLVLDPDYTDFFLMSGPLMFENEIGTTPRHEALRAIAAIGPAASDCLEDLRKLQELFPVSRHRIAIEEAIARVGG